MRSTWKNKLKKEKQRKQNNKEYKFFLPIQVQLRKKENFAKKWRKRGKNRKKLDYERTDTGKN